MSQQVAGRPTQVTVENAQIILRNFSGRITEYNENGHRTFGCLLPPDIAEVMQRDGWNIKFTKVREDGDVPLPWVPVAVSYKNRPPRIVTVTKRFNQATGEFEQVRTSIPEELVEMLDYVDMSHVDLILNPYSWSASGNTGVKAYLKALYITIDMDPLEARYAMIPEASFGEAPLELTDHAHGENVDEILEGEIIEEDYDQ